jgi:hypothetical protein
MFGLGRGGLLSFLGNMGVGVGSFWGILVSYMFIMVQIVYSILIVMGICN